MATLTAILTPDFTNSGQITGAQGTVASGASTGVITVGKRRILHLSAIIPTGSGRCALSYTLGLSTGTTAPTPTNSSPFFMGDEGWTIDTGESFDQINFFNSASYNSAVTISYSISVMSKY
jgi:hypothetical protein